MSTVVDAKSVTRGRILSRLKTPFSTDSEPEARMPERRRSDMGIWLELGIFGLVFVFAFWQMHDVRKAQEQTRQKRAREQAKAAADQAAGKDSA